MKSVMIRLLAASALTLTLGILGACQDDDGAIENAGEKVQDAADDASDAVDDAVD